MIRKYETALSDYMNQQFEKAREEFYEIFIEAGDKTSKIFAERCENYILTPPSTDWDGVYIAKEK